MQQIVAQVMAGEYDEEREGYAMDYRRFYQENIYGIWREGEKVTYTRMGENRVNIQVETRGRQADFTIEVFMPEDEKKVRYSGSAPFIICMHPIESKDCALEHGYGVILMDSYQIASDDDKHVGCFYELYPYGKQAQEQTGVLMAWAWGAAKILDAVYGGLGEELCFDPEASIVTGVSRWGKATAVCGAFDKRFRMVVPACSGAGGLALNGVTSTGKTYNFESIGGPQKYTYGENEPLSCLQSEAERGWFCDRFLDYRDVSEIPVDQEMLPALAAAPDRYYFIIAACMGEDWVNAPAMWECYLKANEIYKQKGLQEHLVIHIHKEGHAVLKEDMELLTAYFDKMYYSMETNLDMAKLKTSVFAEQ